MKQTLFLFLLIINFSFSQKEGDFISLSTIDPSVSFDDLKQLDSIFVGKRIIGLGESTHGTSEFTTMRHRIFKYLVENHDFNTFFLEADYSACQRVNRYIHGADDNVDSALFQVRLFPWISEEMVVLIDWMRSYNFVNDNKLSFVGCDMQIIEDEKSELERFFANRPEFLAKIKTMDSLIYGISKNDVSNCQKANEIWSELRISKNTDSSVTWLMLEKGINQFFECREKINNQQDFYNYRDSAMAENILYYIQLNLNTKGIFFAHNGHVSKYVSENKGQRSVRYAGGFLENILGNSYASFALSTNMGDFLVADYSNSSVPKGLSIVTRDFRKKRSIERLFDATNLPFAFLSSTALTLKSKFSIVDIGGVIGHPPGYKFDMPESHFLGRDHFDGIFFIRNTHALNCLKRYSFNM